MKSNIIKYENIEPKIDKSVKLALSSIIIGNTIIKKNTTKCLICTVSFKALLPFF